MTKEYIIDFRHASRTPRINEMKTASIRLTPEEHNKLLEMTGTDKISIALRTIIDTWEEDNEFINEAVEKVDELRKALDSKDLEIKKLSEQLTSMKEEIGDQRLMIWDLKSNQVNATPPSSITMKILSFIGIVLGIPSFIILILVFVLHL